VASVKHRSVPDRSSRFTLSSTGSPQVQTPGHQVHLAPISTISSTNGSKHSGATTRSRLHMTL
jgi:hypothetical protein